MRPAVEVHDARSESPAALGGDAALSGVPVAADAAAGVHDGMVFALGVVVGWALSVAAPQGEGL